MSMGFQVPDIPRPDMGDPCQGVVGGVLEFIAKTSGLWQTIELRAADGVATAAKR